MQCYKILLFYVTTTFASKYSKTEPYMLSEYEKVYY